MFGRHLRSFVRQASGSAPERRLFRLDQRNEFTSVPQVWVSGLEDVRVAPKEILELHPDVFRAPPRLDILHRNVVWQNTYRNLQLTKQLTKAEMPGGGRKPWPQKKMGRHHAGSIRSPHFIRGGFAHGVRGPRTWFYMLPEALRVQGMCTALTMKLAQNDLHVVDSFDNLPSDDPQLLHDIAEERNFGYSVLFVDSDSASSDNLLHALESIPSFNVTPFFALNCYSLVKYQTVVMSKDAILKVEDALLTRIHSRKSFQTPYQYRALQKTILDESAPEEEGQKYTPFI